MKSAIESLAMCPGRKVAVLGDMYELGSGSVDMHREMGTVCAAEGIDKLITCGELGADPALTETFVRMGVDELSVAPSMILNIRKIVREMTTSF